jgi:hypothetical protein
MSRLKQFLKESGDFWLVLMLLDDLLRHRTVGSIEHQAHTIGFDASQIAPSKPNVNGRRSTRPIKRSEDTSYGLQIPHP